MRLVSTISTVVKKPVIIQQLTVVQDRSLGRLEELLRSIESAYTADVHLVRAFTVIKNEFVVSLMVRDAGLVCGIERIARAVVRVNQIWVVMEV